MLKHGLISNEAMWAELMNFDLEAPDLKLLSRMVGDSVAVKERIVTEDPTEKGIRKALNLGHTVGHAFESLALQRTPVLHGYAVAWGLMHQDRIPNGQNEADRALHPDALREDGHLM